MIGRHTSNRSKIWKWDQSANFDRWPDFSIFQSTRIPNMRDCSQRSDRLPKCLNGNQTLILCKCLNENQTLILCKLFTLKVRVYLVVNLDDKLTVTFKVHHIILWRILNITFLPRRIHRVSPNNNMDLLRKVCTFWRSLCYIKEPPQNCIINIVSQFILVTQG